MNAFLKLVLSTVIACSVCSRSGAQVGDLQACNVQVIKFRRHIGWRQYSIFAARLGMTAEATTLTREKLRDAGPRFPSFRGPGFDWTPDHNWGGPAMIGLQEMLLQTHNRKIYLCPAWPTEWPVRFKLHVPYNTVVEGAVRDGKVVALNVTPASRRADVIIMFGKPGN